MLDDYECMHAPCILHGGRSTDNLLCRMACTYRVLLQLCFIQDARLSREWAVLALSECQRRHGSSWRRRLERPLWRMASSNHGCLHNHNVPGCCSDLLATPPASAPQSEQPLACYRSCHFLEADRLLPIQAVLLQRLETLAVAAELAAKSLDKASVEFEQASAVSFLLPRLLPQLVSLCYTLCVSCHVGIQTALEMLRRSSTWSCLTRSTLWNAPAWNLRSWARA